MDLPASRICSLILKETWDHKLSMPVIINWHILLSRHVPICCNLISKRRSNYKWILYDALLDLKLYFSMILETKEVKSLVK
jgi:hypothetical protein